MREFVYREYILLQEDNNHYMIFNKNNGEWLLHAACTKPLSEDEAKEHIDNFLKYREKKLRERAKELSE